MIAPALTSGHLHPGVVDYLCRTLHAMAVKMGCEVPAWRNDYLIDFHAIMAAREMEAPMEFMGEEDDA